MFSKTKNILLKLKNFLIKISKTNLFKKAFAGCALITGIELIFGIIFNIILKKRVWSYKEMPLNLGGQICARYSFFWLVLSIILMPLAGNLNHKLQSD